MRYQRQRWQRRRRECHSRLWLYQSVFPWQRGVNLRLRFRHHRRYRHLRRLCRLYRRRYRRRHHRLDLPPHQQSLPSVIKEFMAIAPKDFAGRRFIHYTFRFAEMYESGGS